MVRKIWIGLLAALAPAAAPDEPHEAHPAYWAPFCGGGGCDRRSIRRIGGSFRFHRPTKTTGSVPR